MFIDQKQQNQILYWNINRPDRLNAIGTQIAKQFYELSKSAKKLIRTNEIKAIVITATSIQTKSSKVWIAGGDLKELHSLTTSDAKNYSYHMTKASYYLRNLSIPVITLVDGRAIGGGAEIFLMGDLRFAVEGSSLEFKQLNIGLSTGYGGTQRLVELVGSSQTFNILFLSNLVDDKKAHELQLFHELFPRDSELQNEVEKRLERILKLDKGAIYAQKRLINQAHELSFKKSVKMQTSLFAKIWKNNYHKAVLDKFNKGID